MPPSRSHIMELARAIEERRTALQAELREGVNRARSEVYAELAGGAPDSGDEASAGLIVDIQQAEIARDLNELRELEAARKRLGDGTYGVCTDCGGDIAPERLSVEPAAARCLECQRHHERTHRA